MVRQREKKESAPTTASNGNDRGAHAKGESCAQEGGRGMYIQKEGSFHFILL